MILDETIDLLESKKQLPELSGKQYHQIATWLREVRILREEKKDLQEQIDSLQAQLKQTQGELSWQLRLKD